MGNLGMWEILVILLVVLLLFGAKRLPDAARGLGRSLRIFKAETKGLMDDDDDDATKTDSQRQIDARSSVEPARPLETHEEQTQPRPDAER